MPKFWDYIHDDSGGRMLRLEGPIDSDSFSEARQYFCNSGGRYNVTRSIMWRYYKLLSVICKYTLFDTDCPQTAVNLSAVCPENL